MRAFLRAAVALAIVIVAGLASRQYPLPLPGPLAKRVGDALWATAAFVGLRLLRPRWTTRRVAVVALAVAFAVEFSQAYHQPQLDQFRSHGIGHLLLGSGFSWFDQMAYIVGVAAVLPVDAWLLRAPG
jgi:hypothetical protein